MTSVTYLSKQQDSDNRTTYTYTGVSFGTASSDRKIIVATASRDTDNHSISSITIGGVAATIVVTTQGTVASYQEQTIAIADVPTGTSGDIVVTYSGQMSDNFLFCWAVTGITSNTATDTDVQNGNPVTGSVDVIKGGVIIAFALVGINTSMTWDGVTLDHTGLSSAGIGISCASGVIAETTFSKVITPTPSTATSTDLVIASFSAVAAFTNPGNAYVSDNTYATLAATSGDLNVEVSKDGGSTYSTPLTKTFGASDTLETYGNGSTELWGLSFTRADMIDANFRVRVSHGIYSQVYKTFGFATGSDTLTGIEIAIEANYATSTISIDLIKVKIYYGTSVLPIQAGSQAYASNGRKNGEGAGAGTGVLVFHDGTAWRACDTGASVAA